MISSYKNLRIVFSIAILFSTLSISPAYAAKNVIVMISDGAGYNSCGFAPKIVSRGEL